MNQDRKPPQPIEKKPTPLTEEKGLQPAKNTPPMPQVKPPKPE